MQNVAEVHYPPENCRFSTYILRHLHTWVYDQKLYEVLHIDQSLLINPDKNRFVRTDLLNDLDAFEKHGRLYIPKDN